MTKKPTPRKRTSTTKPNDLKLMNETLQSILNMEKQQLNNLRLQTDVLGYTSAFIILYILWSLGSLMIHHLSGR